MIILLRPPLRFLSFAVPLSLTISRLVMALKAFIPNAVLGIFAQNFK